jgi:hypothetical protein
MKSPFRLSWNDQDERNVKLGYLYQILLLFATKNLPKQGSLRNRNC